MEGVQSQSALVAGLILLGLSINVLFERRRIEHRVAFAILLIGFSIYNLAWCACAGNELGERLLAAHSPTLRSHHCTSVSELL